MAVDKYKRLGNPKQRQQSQNRDKLLFGQENGMPSQDWVLMAWPKMSKILTPHILRMTTMTMDLTQFPLSPLSTSIVTITNQFNCSSKASRNSVLSGLIA